MSAIDSLSDYLSGGASVTARQIRAMFKVSNPYDLVYRLRNEGVSVYTNRVVNSRGLETFAYRIGSPSEAFERAIDGRRLDRARKTLYRNALAA